MDTQTQVERLIELAIVQRTELRQLVEQLPQLREHLNAEIERTFEEVEPQIRTELEEFCAARATDEHAKTGAALAAKIDELSKQLEATTSAKYSVLMAERAHNVELERIATEQVAQAAKEIPQQVKAIVADELSRFPRAGEIDQLRKEFATPAGLNPRGKWQSGQTYERLDVVSYNGNSYIANGKTSEKPSADSSAWTINAARGTGGGGPSSLNELTQTPTNGSVLIGSGTSWVTSTLTAGTGISIANAAGSITINATDGNITLDDGTAAAPALNFTNYPTTGLYSSAANAIGFATSGVARAAISSTGLAVTGTITPTGSVHAAAGSVGNPSIAFSADQDTGLYSIGANNIGIAANGAKVLDISTTGLTVTGALGATSLTAPASTDLTLSGGSSGASLVLGQGAAGEFTLTSKANATIQTATGAWIYNDTSSTGPQIVMRKSGTAHAWFGTDAAWLGGVGTDYFMAARTNIRFFTNFSGTEHSRLTTTGNLLIGTTTDMSGSGGLKVAGTTASTGASTGALQVAGGIYAGAASVFATDIMINGARAGIGVGSVASNTLFGNNSLANASQTGTYNSAFGQYALNANTSGSNNTSVGNSSLGFNTTGSGNSAFGTVTLYSTTTGGSNTAVGANALRTNTSGSSNVAVGVNSFYYNSTGSNNVGLGYNAGAYETGSNAFYVDNQNRTDTAGEKAKALLYGTFNATAANQTLAINAVVSILNTVNSVSPTSPNRTITMVVGGVTLYIAAKTTND